jgi:hypothetical protein
VKPGLAQTAITTNLPGVEIERPNSPVGLLSVASPIHPI